MTFEEIYVQHYQYVYGVCFGIYRNRADAEDATQDTFVRVFQKLHQFASRSKLTSWLYRVAYNTCLMRIRSARGSTRNGGVQVSLECVAQEKCFEFHPTARVDLSRALSKLSPVYKRTLKQHALKGLEHTEIARATGNSIGASKSNLSKARIKIRKLLEGYK